MEQLPELWDIQRTASYLHVSVSKLYQLTARKQIPFYRVGRRCLFTRQMIEEWLESHMVKVEQEGEQL